MSNYVHSSSLRYEDYLQAKSFEDGIRGEISASSRSIIASTEELARDKITVLKSLSSELTSGFEQLSFDLRALSDDVAELNSTFRWGFSAVLTHLGGLNDSLRELIRIAKTPEQTWAYEQFEIARDAFRQALYDDAILSLNRAISGFGDHTGYTLEYRFHYLLGIIHIGSFENHTPQIVDLPQAEQAFLNAAKYACRDLPEEAARGYLGAGWSAYCQGNMQTAKNHTQAALALDASLAEAHFQLAKVQAHRGNPEAALTSLRNAIILDRGYTVKACTDGDFIRYQSQVDAFLENLRKEAVEAAQRTFASIESEIDHLEKSRAEQFPLAESAPIGTVKKLIVSAKKTATSGTYYSMLEAIRLCESAKSAASDALRTLRQEHEQKARQLECLSSQAREKAGLAMWLSLGGIIIWPLGVAGFTLGLMALSKFRQDGADQNGKGKAYAAVAIGGGVIFLILAIMYSAKHP